MYIVLFFWIIMNYSISMIIVAIISIKFDANFSQKNSGLVRYEIFG